MDHWVYKDRVITTISDMPTGAVGFVYRLTHLPTGTMYVGKKILEFSRTKALTKRELAEQTGKGRRPRSKKVTQESDWLIYRGSNKEFLALTKDCPSDHLLKEILCFCPTKKSLTYNELKHQVLLQVLEKSEYMNGNLLGKFYSKDCEVIDYEV